jgi:hypothetical protein
MRRYEFHREGQVVWSLVFDKKVNRWCIEMWEPQKESVQFAFAEFENSAHGSRLSEQLAEAVREAEADA